MDFGERNDGDVCFLYKPGQHSSRVLLERRGQGTATFNEATDVSTIALGQIAKTAGAPEIGHGAIALIVTMATADLDIQAIAVHVNTL